MNQPLRPDDAWLRQRLRGLLDDQAAADPAPALQQTVLNRWRDLRATQRPGAAAGLLRGRRWPRLAVVPALIVTIVVASWLIEGRDADDAQLQVDVLSQMSFGEL